MDGWTDVGGSVDKGGGKSTGSRKGSSFESLETENGKRLWENGVEPLWFRDRGPTLLPPGRERQRHLCPLRTGGRGPSAAPSPTVRAVH